MKLKKKIFALVAVLMTTVNVLASEVTVITMLNGKVNTAVGTVAHSESGGVCTLTVTPASGYYIDVITAEKTMDGGMAQAPRRRASEEGPGMNNFLSVTGPQSPFDPSAESQWQFTMPSSEYNVEVVANFKARTSIADATITLAATEVTYNGQAQTPAVTKVVLNGSELSSNNYEVSYSDNTAAGNATVTVTGKNTYTGSASTTFTIKKAAINLVVGINDWTYGEEGSAVATSGNDGNGEVTISYKVSGAGDDTYDTTQPTNAGSYVVKVDVAETANYAAGSATAEFTIFKANLSLGLTVQDWTYGATASTPNLTGNLGEGAVTYTYANAEAPSAEYSQTVPTNAGSYLIKAAVAATANYNAGETNASFSINKANLNVVTIANIDNKTFTGEAIEPSVNVTFNGATVDASEYNIGYSDNISVGEATVTLTATGINFTAGTTATKTFQILEATAVITAQDQTETYNGGPQMFTNYDVDKGDKENIVVHYYASEADRASDAEELEVVVDAGTYYVKLTQSDLNYHAEPAYAVFTINPKALSGDMVQDLVETSFVYDGNAKTLSFFMYDNDLKSELAENEDYTVSYENNVNVGVATATVTGEGNYTGSFTVDFDIMRQLNISFSETNSWATYCATEDLTIPEYLQAYIVTGIDGSSVSVEQIDYLPANEGVLLHLEEPALASDDFIAGKDNAAHSELPENLLVGLTAATPVRSLTTENMNIYILYNDEFVKTTTGTIPANRCFLFVDLDVNAEARLSIDFETTGIEKLTKDLSNVKGAYYDLQGRKVAQPVKGLYIVNGRKVVVK